MVPDPKYTRFLLVVQLELNERVCGLPYGSWYA
jgi:hypothetical protein